MDFNQFQLSEKILKALKEYGYNTATEIQQKSIPITLKGTDLLGCAQTGTGKTAAFAIPILQRLLSKPKGKLTPVRALVLTPTRELALQIEENFIAYSKYLNLDTLAIFGGVSQEKQVDRLKKGVDILIATPGRLIDLMQQGLLHLDKVEILVLDEADRMLDMGFVNDVKKIIKSIPTKRQTLLFSATMPTSITKLADSVLYQPQKISVAAISSTAETVAQKVCFVEKQDKANTLVQLLQSNPKDESSLVFTRTKYGADKLVKQLVKKGITAAAIHGNKTQNARQRALTEFKNNSIRVLVATDIASRGIDIDQLPLVVNYELPEVPETYVHRIGRTGRAGKQGKAISFCASEEKNDLKDIQKLIGFKIPEMSLSSQ